MDPLRGKEMQSKIADYLKSRNKKLIIYENPLVKAMLSRKFIAIGLKTKRQNK